MNENLYWGVGDFRAQNPTLKFKGGKSFGLALWLKFLINFLLVRYDATCNFHVL